MDDDKIIELLFERSEQAIEELDDKYGKLCFNLSYNIVGSSQDAEECVNDAYLGIWSAIPPNRPLSLVSYLCKVVRNISLNAFHKNNAAKRNSAYSTTLDEIEEIISDGASLEDEIETAELTKEIEGFLETLSSENRVIFIRRYWFSDSCAEIAERTGLSTKNITVRLTRIRQKLKKYLEERGVNI